MFMGILFALAESGDVDGIEWQVHHLSENCCSAQYLAALERHLATWTTDTKVMNSGDLPGVPERRKRQIGASFRLPTIVPTQTPTTVAQVLPQYDWTDEEEVWMRSGTGSSSLWYPTVQRPAPRPGLKPFNGQIVTITGNSVYVYRQPTGGPYPNGADNKSPIPVREGGLILPAEAAKLRGKGRSAWRLRKTVRGYPNGHGENCGEQDRMVGIGVCPALSALLAEAACIAILGEAARVK